MAASREEVDRWINDAKTMGATHIISVCDTFDWDDYPVYVMPDEDLEEKKKQYNGVNMQKINEVITMNSNGTINEPGLESAVQASGFSSQKEFFSMVSGIDLSNPDKLEKFIDWKDNDGTKAGLEKISNE